jgi:RNA polymerase sigma factor (sigma-70 family)
MTEIIQHLRRTMLLRDGAGMTDGQLLEDYISRRDEAALAALVRRHAPMVWGVCRRVLPNYHDAEDAFQATFLVLVRKSGSIASRELLANWLYGVAHQTALKARATAAKRCARERQGMEMPEPAVVEQDDLWRDLQPLLDEELSRLPDKYRAVIILCDLEGKTRKEAARQLGVPEGTVASRLATARVMLAKRLTQRGVALSGGVLAAAVMSHGAAAAGVPTSVIFSTIKAVSSLAAGQAAAGVISVKVAVLTEGVLKAMFVTKLKTATAALFMVALVGIGGGATARLAGNDGEVTTGVAVARGAESLKENANSSQNEKSDAEDGQFMRRTYLDLLGVLPTADEVKQFQQDKAADKRKRLVARLHVRATMEDVLRKLPDDEARRLALEEIEKLVKAQKGKQPETKLAKELVLDGKGLFYDVSAAPGTHIKKSGEGVAIVTIRDIGNYTLSMDGPGTLYLLGTDDYSTVEVIRKTGDGDLVWVTPNPKSARIGPTVKGKIDGKGKIRMGTLKEVDDLRSAAGPKQGSRLGAGDPARRPLQQWLVASARQDKPFDRLVRDCLALKSATWEEWLDEAAFGR